jgi:hypothetical protein
MQVPAGHGRAGRGGAWRGSARHGAAWRGEAGHGQARRGTERQCKGYDLLHSDGGHRLLQDRIYQRRNTTKPHGIFANSLPAQIAIDCNLTR